MWRTTLKAVHWVTVHEIVHAEWMFETIKEGSETLHPLHQSWIA